MLYENAEILVMARAPVPGQAKTRLIPALGKEGAATLHAYMVEQLLETLTQAAVAPVTLCVTPDIDHPFFIHCQARYGVSLQRQQGDDLGSRMHTALVSSLKKRSYAVVIGCDIPLLGATEIKMAIEALMQGADAAISPSEDGGYALLALQRVTGELFDGIEWGGQAVLAQTRAKLRKLGWRCRELTTLWDVDWPEDLQRLAELPLPLQIKELLQVRPAG